MTLTEIKQQLFSVSSANFEEIALNLFRIQAKDVEIYKSYIQQLGIDPESVRYMVDIPFLPVSLFKSHKVLHQTFAEHDLNFFQSSGTSGLQGSQHWIADEKLYFDSFTKGFNTFFENPEHYIILGLLPSYLENGFSSLVFMVNKLIQLSGQKESGFYLHDHKKLAKLLIQIEEENKPCLLFGVTYALLDFAEQFPMNLRSTRIIETGGMKGRREELTRSEVHQKLKSAFSLNQIYSEYGMTEMFSQAYALQNGLFHSPPWMKILIRDLNDPFDITPTGKGLLNCIDLANLYSCAFIATDDLGEVFDDNSFMVNGRLDHSELRGCSLMVN